MKLNRDEPKRLKDRAEECLAVSEIVRDPQVREAYVQMAEAYLSLAGDGSDNLRVPASSAKKVRPQFPPETSLKDRLKSFATEMRDKAAHLPSGAQKDALLKKVRLADVAAHLEDWANSGGLRPPK